MFIFFIFVADIDTYLQHFTWEEAKYPIRNSLKELTDKIHIVCFLFFLLSHHHNTE